jgi:hypothetical protein
VIYPTRKTGKKFQSIELVTRFTPYVVETHIQTKDYKIPWGNQDFKEVFEHPSQKPCYWVLHGRDRPCEVCPTFTIFDETSAPLATLWKRENGKTYLNLTEPTPDLSLAIESLFVVPEEHVPLFESIFEKNKDQSLCTVLKTIKNKILEKGETPPNWLEDLRGYLDRRKKKFTFLKPALERERTSGPTSL